MVVLEVREPAGGRERARYTWSRGVLLLPNFGIARRRGWGVFRLRNIAVRAYKKLLLRGLLHRTG